MPLTWPKGIINTGHRAAMAGVPLPLNAEVRPRPGADRGSGRQDPTVTFAWSYSGAFSRYTTLS
jgi:hypothetical protein